MVPKIRTQSLHRPVIRPRQVHYVHGRCLVNHAPSPQQCALSGGVWDDTIMYQASSFGGVCVSAKTVLERVRAHPAAYELLELNVTFDRESFSYDKYPFIELRCLRFTNRSLWYRMETYGRVCAGRVDLADLPDNLPPHPWDSWVPSPEHGKAEAGGGEAGRGEGESGELAPEEGERWEAAPAGEAKLRDEL